MNLTGNHKKHALCPSLDGDPGEGEATTGILPFQTSLIFYSRKSFDDVAQPNIRVSDFDHGISIMESLGGTEIMPVDRTVKYASTRKLALYHATL